MKSVALSVPLLLISATLLHAGSVYVQPLQSKIHEKPSLTAPVVATVPQGSCFENALRRGGWFEVTWQGRKGWVPALVVAATPPKQKVAARGEESSPTIRLRSRASAAPTVVAGMKGLASDDRRRLSSGQKVDYDALEEMERLVVTDEEVEWFGKGGKP